MGDLEHVCVTFAVHDIAYFLTRVKSWSDRRLFVHEYLIASGFESGNQDVDNVLFDAECCMSAAFNIHDPKDFTKLKIAQNLIEQARRGDTSLRSKIVSERMKGVI